MDSSIVKLKIWGGVHIRGHDGTHCHSQDNENQDQNLHFIDRMKLEKEKNVFYYNAL